MSEFRFTSAAVIDELAELKRLPSFSNILNKFDELVAQPGGAHIDDVVALVSLDPRLVAGVLQVVNSARYSPGFIIEDVSQAVARLGVTDIRVMIVALSFKSMFHDDVPINTQAFLNHSIISAFIGRKLARYFKLEPYEAFMMGLLHEVGLFVLATYNQQAFRKMTEESMHKLTRLLASERNVYAVTHASVGGRLLQRWNFPDMVVMGVVGHHAPIRIDQKYQNAAYLTQLTESGTFYLGQFNGVVTTDKGVLTDTVKQSLKRAGLSEDLYLEILEQAYEEAEQTGFLA